MEKYNLFLDDVRIPSDAYNYTKDTSYLKKKWTVVRNYDEFCKCIKNSYERGYFLETVSFDHDLMDIHYQIGDMSTDVKDYKNLEKTGYHCAVWLCEFCIDNKLKMPEILIHSMNPVGKKRIQDTIKDYKKEFEL